MATRPGAVVYPAMYRYRRWSYEQNDFQSHAVSLFIIISDRAR